jgi:hypothetical protein
MDGKHAFYRSYLLRLWTVREQGQVVWRASLEHPHTGERLHFTSLARLFAFLQDQTGAAADGAGRPSEK